MTKKNITKTNLLQNNKFVFVFWLLFFTSSLWLNAQDNTTEQENSNEQTAIKFQEFFFEAITQKAINNYKKAIENLEECNVLHPNSKAVLFELAKNYYLLGKIPEAVEYGNQALKKEPANIWILELLVAINQKGKNFDEAIKYQQIIAKQHPKKKKELVFLHLKNKDVSAAKQILSELAQSKMLNPRLRRIQASLNKAKKTNKKTVTTSSKIIKNDLKEQFKKDKSFVLLKKLLQKLDNTNNSELLQYSNKGLTLFPAQPFVYLMNGKALNKKGDYKNAINSLKNGIDFVIDNKKMETQFYTELLKAYKALGDKKNVKKYKEKLSN